MTSNKSCPNIAAIVLAAGASKRMGTIKQLLPWQHTTLIGHTLQTLSKSNIDTIYVVLGANDSEIEKEIKAHQTLIVKNMDWKEGMGTSIAVGMKQIIKSNQNYQGVLIVLTDQPLIDVSCINQLIVNFKDNLNHIISAQIKNHPGVPAIFPSKHIHTLAKLSGQTGAKKMIANHMEENIMIDFGDKTQDIDTPEAYNYLYGLFGNAMEI